MEKFGWAYRTVEVHPMILLVRALLKRPFGFICFLYSSAFICVNLCESVASLSFSRGERARFWLHRFESGSREFRLVPNGVFGGLENQRN
jgi:hypothetical protein